MPVRVEVIKTNPFGNGERFVAKSLDGYRANELITSEKFPVTDIDRNRLTKWLKDTGYTVVNECYEEHEETAIEE